MSARAVRVRYFALLREQRGVAEEKVSTSAATAADLYRELQGRHGLTFPAARLRVAINDVFAQWNTALKPGDTVVFIPPVAGG